MPIISIHHYLLPICPSKPTKFECILDHLTTFANKSLLLTLGTSKLLNNLILHFVERREYIFCLFCCINVYSPTNKMYFCTVDITMLVVQRAISLQCLQQLRCRQCTSLPSQVSCARNQKWPESIRSRWL